MSTDTLTITCHFCDRVVARKRVEAREHLSPSLAARWHERMAAHIRKEHGDKPQREAR